FLRTTLTLAIDELVSILKVIMTFDRFGYVIAGVQSGAVQCFHQPNLVFIDHRGIVKPNGKQARLDIRAAFKRHRLIENAIRPGCKNIYLGASLSAGRDKELGVLKTEMPGNRFTQKSAGIKRSAVSSDDHADLALWNHRGLGH